MEDYILEMKGITKTFPGVVALKSVDIAVKRCEVHALIGENGAGKSTLMKVLNGVYTANSGEIYLNGEKITLKNTTDAKKQGLGLIFQEFNLVNSLSAAENIYMNRLRRKRGHVDWKQINRDAQELVDSLDFNFKVTEKVENLSAAQKQLVEIAKVLTFDAKIIVMDEPTSSLTSVETEKLFKIIAKLKESGITIIYISHKLDEIFAICDTATVMRDGEVIDTRPVSEYTRAQIIERMVGRSVDMEYPRRSVTPGEVVLNVDRITRSGIIRDISFELHKGEILGIAGLVGSGRTELAEAIFGAEKYDGGVITIGGKKVVIHSTNAGKKHGIGLLTEDRKETGLVLAYDIMRNITVTNLPKIKTGPFLSAAKEKKLASQYSKELNVKTPSIKQLAINLSGGNQQKVVFAKWLFSDVDVLILDEPTRGIDVGAKYEIYLLMNRLAEQGKSIIMISSELPEVLGMSDRVIVLNEGSKKGELSREMATPEAVMNMAIN
jgi:ribose transport system ATP-binding protein